MYALEHAHIHEPLVHLSRAGSSARYTDLSVLAAVCRFYVRAERRASWCSELNIDGFMCTRFYMWDNEKCLLLIDLYESKRILWDGKYENHFNRREKDDAWKYISEALHIDLEEIKKKMNSLLGSFRRERSRQKRSSTTGKGSGEIYKSKWFAFERMQFLSHKNGPIRTVDTMNSERIELHDDDGESQSQPTAEIRDPWLLEAGNRVQVEIQNSSAKKPRKTTALRLPILSSMPRKKTRMQTNKTTRPIVLQTLKALKDSFKYMSDTYVAYGLHIANELRKYDKTTLACVKHAINNIIFDADMGNLGQRNDNYNEANYYHQATTNPATSPNNESSSRKSFKVEIN